MSIFETKVFLVIFVSSLLFNVLNAEGEIELIIFTRKCSTINNYYFREKKTLASGPHRAEITSFTH
jgi:hypothetical protein